MAENLTSTFDARKASGYASVGCVPHAHSRTERREEA